MNNIPLKQSAVYYPSVPRIKSEKVIQLAAKDRDTTTILSSVLRVGLRPAIQSDIRD